MPWAAVAAATALVTLGGVDKSAYADLLPSQEPSLSGPNAAAAGDEGHLLSASSLSAPFLVFAEGLPSDSAATVPLETANTVDLFLFNSAGEPLQHAFNPDDFRAKLPERFGMPGGGIPGVGGEWFFSSSKTSSRECPAWGSNKNIEMVVPGAAKPLQPQPPRGSKRWFASFSEADTSQLQGSEVESADEQGRLEVLEVVNPVGESAQQKEGEGAPAKAEKDPFEGLIFEIIRMPVFSCFSL
jgi:hypothetical protein